MLELQRILSREKTQKGRELGRAEFESTSLVLMAVFLQALRYLLHFWAVLHRSGHRAGHMPGQSFRYNVANAVLLVSLFI